jgi:hypothetical protein
MIERDGQSTKRYGLSRYGLAGHFSGRPRHPLNFKARRFFNQRCSTAKGIIMTDESKPVADWRNDPDLSATWKFRFDFYDRYGTRTLMNASDEFKAAFKNLGFADRIKVNANLWAFFFSFIYLFILGLWRQAVLVLAAVLGLSVAFMLLSSVAPGILADIISRATGILFGFFVAIRTNVWYYHEKTKGDIGWTL